MHEEKRNQIGMIDGKESIFASAGELLAVSTVGQSNEWIRKHIKPLLSALVIGGSLIGGAFAADQEVETRLMQNKSHIQYVAESSNAVATCPFVIPEQRIQELTSRLKDELLIEPKIIEDHIRNQVAISCNDDYKYTVSSEAVSNHTKRDAMIEDYIQARVEVGMSKNEVMALAAKEWKGVYLIAEKNFSPEMESMLRDGQKPNATVLEKARARDAAYTFKQSITQEIASANGTSDPKLRDQLKAQISASEYQYFKSINPTSLKTVLHPNAVDQVLIQSQLKIMSDFIAQGKTKELDNMLSQVRESLIKAMSREKSHASDAANLTRYQLFEASFQAVKRQTLNNKRVPLDKAAIATTVSAVYKDVLHNIEMRNQPTLPMTNKQLERALTDENQEVSKAAVQNHIVTDKGNILFPVTASSIKSVQNVISSAYSKAPSETLTSAVSKIKQSFKNLGYSWNLSIAKDKTAQTQESLAKQRHDVAIAHTDPTVRAAAAAAPSSFTTKEQINQLLQDFNPVVRQAVLTRQDVSLTQAQLQRLMNDESPAVINEAFKKASESNQKINLSDRQVERLMGFGMQDTLNAYSASIKFASQDAAELVKSKPDPSIEVAVKQVQQRIPRNKQSTMEI